MSIKIAVIGAGSLGFTLKLMHDVLAVPELRDTVFSFHDISKQNLDMVTQLARRDIKANKLPARVLATTVRRTALRDANYVLNLTRIGGLEAFRQDIEIPLKYGVDQCVGDTLAMGGIMYGQRNIAAILDFCRDIREVAAPGVLFINYANPMAMNTWAATVYGGVDTVGLCHGVQGGHAQITEVIQLLVNGKKKEGAKGYRTLSTSEVDIVCAGINHQTWYTSIRYKGEDWCDRLLEGFEQHPIYRENEKVRIDMLRQFGYFSTESNGHLSEYLPWYRKRPREIRRWISTDSWINGETGGYLRVCTEGRNWFETDFPKMLAEDAPDLSTYSRSNEHGSWIIEALETGRIYRGHFNRVNQGCIGNLPADAVIEAPGYVDRTGIHMPPVDPLPPGCAAVCSNSIGVQRLAVLAAVEGNLEYLRQAALMDPLTGAVCTTEEICQMVDEMLIAQAAWLPQYRKEIPKAQKRFASAKKLGTRSTKGAVRIKTKTVAEMKKNAGEARRNATAGDKAALSRAKQAQSIHGKKGKATL